jgi:thiamine pyrophosphokinase
LENPQKKSLKSLKNLGNGGEMKKCRKIAILANGAINNIGFHKKILKNADCIICADGGANSALKLGIVPDYIIGDIDSARKNTLKKFRKNKKTKIIRDPRQDKTDLELAINLAENLQAKELIILGALGMRIDHELSNIICLYRIKKGISAKITDERNEIEIVRHEIEISGKKNDVISVIPLDEVKGLTYKGLKWGVKNKNVKFGWFGTCNKMLGKKAKISLKKGAILVMKAVD